MTSVGGGGFKNRPILRTNSTDKLREVRTRGRGVNNPQIFADVLYGWSLTKEGERERGKEQIPQLRFLSLGDDLPRPTKVELSLCRATLNPKTRRLESCYHSISPNEVRTPKR